MPAEIIPQPVDLITIDVSFISLKIVVPAVIKFMKKAGIILALIKPQFEVGKGKVGKGGVVRDKKLHDEVIKDLSDFFIKTGFSCKSIMPSSILGPKGNREFMIALESS
ncbi:MAG: TlyA family rRNA (cytidine-2'-O)-methyltransferase, partial [Desulfobacterales bacterium]|nr:TlyA family rRNA (cytidine-2'-O)-methyltransferase [Desulfobacterales bacterium]